MKKILYISIGSLLISNLLFFFDYTKKDSYALNNHAVSINAAEASEENLKPLVSSGIADIVVVRPEVMESNDNFQESFPNLFIDGEVASNRLELIQKTLLSLPIDNLQTLTTLRIIQEEGQSRGLGGTSTIILNEINLSDEEFVSVLVHELGHIIDLGGIRGTPAFPRSDFNDGSNPIYRNDRSVIFYGYSWIDTYQKLQTADRLDFVSGYAMTDPFEDFAESFVFYVLHNREFKLLSQKNESLELKYNWISKNIFNGEEPDTGKMQANSSRRVWDITKLSIEI